MINAFSDASFAPEGDYSHGCAAVLLQHSPILWKSGKQPVATLSTAEAELLEVVETMTMGESIHVVVNEINPGISRVAWCDSQAAVSILSSEGGSWRTRHLRVRASYARATIKEGNWLYFITWPELKWWWTLEPKFSLRQGWSFSRICWE